MLSWETSSKHTPTNGVEDNHRMSFTVFLGNLPAWVTADDIKGWLTAENLVADAIKVIRNPETQESKGFAFIDAPNAEEIVKIVDEALTAAGEEYVSAVPVKVEVEVADEWVK